MILLVTHNIWTIRAWHKQLVAQQAAQGVVIAVNSRDPASYDRVRGWSNPSLILWDGENTGPQEYSTDDYKRIAALKALLKSMRAEVWINL